MSDKKWLNYAGEIATGKDGKSKSIRVTKAFTALRGNTILLTSYEDYLTGLVTAGKMTEEEKSQKLTKIHWVSYVLTVPPQEKKEDLEELPPVEEGKWVNNAMELRKAKDGKLYFKVQRDFSVTEGTYIPLQKFEDKQQKLLDGNFITQEQFEENMKLAEYIKYVAAVPPKK